MKKVHVLVLAVVAALMLVTSAQANRGGVPHKNAPTAPVLSFSCDGTLCTYAVSPGPLAPSTAYDTSYQFVPLIGLLGCNTGTGGWHTDATGAFVQRLDEDEIKGGSLVPGFVTVWARDAGSPWNAPAIPGTLTDPPVLIS